MELDVELLLPGIGLLDIGEHCFDGRHDSPFSVNDLEVNVLSEIREADFGQMLPDPRPPSPGLLASPGGRTSA